MRVVTILTLFVVCTLSINAMQDCEYDEWTSWSKCTKGCSGLQYRSQYSISEDEECGTIIDERQCHPPKRCGHHHTIQPAPAPAPVASLDNVELQTEAQVSEEGVQVEADPNAVVSGASKDTTTTTTHSNRLQAMVFVMVGIGCVALVAIAVVTIFLFHRARLPKQTNTTPTSRKTFRVGDQGNDSNDSYDDGQSNNSYDTEPGTPYSPDVHLNSNNSSFMRGSSKGIVVGKEAKTFAYTLDELHSLQL